MAGQTRAACMHACGCPLSGLCFSTFQDGFDMLVQEQSCALLVLC